MCFSVYNYFSFYKNALGLSKTGHTSKWAIISDLKNKRWVATGFYESAKQSFYGDVSPSI